MIDHIIKNLDAGKIPIAVYLDLSKAFDTLNHEILLTKLKFYGLSGICLNWFRSYLSDRCQYVEVDGIKSSTESLKTGVPQGSILGPLLFVIYMNDIHEASYKFHAILFADDSNMTSTLCSFDVCLSTASFNKTALTKNINLELQSIHEWLAIKIVPKYQEDQIHVISFPTTGYYEIRT